MQTFIIDGRLPSYNDLHTSWQKSRRIKQEAMDTVILAALAMKPITEPSICHIACFEPNAKRDCDNVMSGASKIILDALQKCGKLQNDSRRWIDLRFAPVKVDKDKPRVEVSFATKQDVVDAFGKKWAMFWEGKK